MWMSKVLRFLRQAVRKADLKARFLLLLHPSTAACRAQEGFLRTDRWAPSQTSAPRRVLRSRADNLRMARSPVSRLTALRLVRPQSIREAQGNRMSLT